jgi:hypothetical protein
MKRITRKAAIAALSCAAILTITSCSDQGTDTHLCFLAVTKKAGEGAKIGRIPGRRYNFIVQKKDGTLWEYRCGAISTPNVTEETQIW